MKTQRSHLKLATGMTVAATFALGSFAHAADNPFGMQKLGSGYQLAQASTEGKKADGKCGEAKCGAAKTADKKKDGQCGADKKKEASCGADKKKEGSCGGDKKKDASCGAKK